MNKKTGYNEVPYVMLVSAVIWTVAHCCNTANSFLIIDEKTELLNKWLGAEPLLYQYYKD